VLKRGFVVVGQLPNNGGTPEPGSILFLDKNGTPVLKYTNVTGPWDLAIDDDFDHMAALVVGPTGLAYDAEADVLYVASTSDNEILHAETTNTSVLKASLSITSGIGRALLPKGPERMF
jgi:hypothetical protein